MVTVLSEKAPSDSQAPLRDGEENNASSGEAKSSREYNALYKRASSFFGGTVALFLLGLISFPILARIFTVEQYGLVALISGTVTVAVVLSKFGLQTSVQRFYQEHAVSLAPENLKRYYSTVYLTAGFLGILVSVPFAILAFYRYLPHSVVSDQIQMLCGYASGLIFLRSVSSMMTNLLQVEGRTTAYNLQQILTRAATISVTVLLLLSWRRDPAVFFVGTVTVELAAVLIMAAYLLRRGRLSLTEFDWTICRESVIFGFPMMGTEILWLILDSGDRFLVEGFLGPKQLGLYAAAYNISGYIRDSLSSPLYLALFPIVMEVWVNKGREQTQAFLTKSMNYFVLASIGIVVASGVCASDAINIVASPKFNEAHRLLPYLVTGMMISALSMFLKSGLMIYKKTVLMFKVNLFSCIVNVVMNIVLLPRIGLLGAALATLCSFIVMTSLFAYYAQVYLPLKIEWFAWLKYCGVGGLTWFVISRLDISNFLVSFLVRGSLSMLVYFGILYLSDARARNLTNWAMMNVARALKLSAPPYKESAA